MAKPFALLCSIVGHRRSRARTWHDNLNFRSRCVLCGASMIRNFNGTWRAFEPADASPLRSSRDEMKLAKRAKGGPVRKDGAPEIWARRLLVTFGDARGVDPGTVFDRLISSVPRHPAVAAALARGEMDAEAADAIARTARAVLRLHTPLPEKTQDQLIQYVFARCQVRATLTLKTSPLPLPGSASS